MTSFGSKEEKGRDPVVKGSKDREEHENLGNLRLQESPKSRASSGPILRPSEISLGGPRKSPPSALSAPFEPSLM